MNHSVLSAACLSLLLIGATAAQAATVDIELTNITHNIYFTPLLVTAHPSDTQLFSSGEAATTGLQAMAEGGDISLLLADLGGAEPIPSPTPQQVCLAQGKPSPQP